MKFTVEEEVDESLPFLDILITRSQDGILTAVYRKTTHSGVYTHFTSFVPFRMKRQMINTLLHRAYELCSNYNILHKEFERLNIMFQNNGFQRDLISNCIYNFMNNKFSPFQKYFGPQPKQLFIRLPYLGEATTKVENVLKSCLNKIPKCGTIQFKVFYNYSRIGDKLKYKDRSSNKSNCVYKVNCQCCDASYIGETGRNVSVRMAEHANSTAPQIKSEVARHIFETGHNFNLDEPEILCFEPNMFKRRILEALYIQEHSPSLNVQIQSYKLHLFEVPTYVSEARA